MEGWHLAAPSPADGFQHQWASNEIRQACPQTPAPGRGREAGPPRGCGWLASQPAPRAACASPAGTGLGVRTLPLRSCSRWRQWHWRASWSASWTTSCLRARRKRWAFNPAALSASASEQRERVPVCHTHPAQAFEDNITHWRRPMDDVTVPAMTLSAPRTAAMAGSFSTPLERHRMGGSLIRVEVSSHPVLRRCHRISVQKWQVRMVHYLRLPQGMLRRSPMNPGYRRPNSGCGSNRAVSRGHVVLLLRRLFHEYHTVTGYGQRPADICPDGTRTENQNIHFFQVNLPSNADGGRNSSKRQM